MKTLMLTCSLTSSPPHPLTSLIPTSSPSYSLTSTSSLPSPHLLTSPSPHLHLLTSPPPHLLTSSPPHLPHSQVLQKNMQLLMDNVDTLQQDLYRLLGYEKNLAKQQQAKQQFIQRRVRLGPPLCTHNSVYSSYGGHLLFSRKRRMLVARREATLLSQSQRRWWNKNSTCGQ